MEENPVQVDNIPPSKIKRKHIDTTNIESVVLIIKKKTTTKTYKILKQKNHFYILPELFQKK